MIIRVAAVGDSITAGSPWDDDPAVGAEALVVQGGINDLAQGRSTADAAANLAAMVWRGRELGLRVAVANVLPWNNGWPGAEAPIRELNGLIAARGQAGCGRSGRSRATIRPSTATAASVS